MGRVRHSVSPEFQLNPARGLYGAQWHSRHSIRVGCDPHFELLIVAIHNVQKDSHNNVLSPLLMLP